MERLNSLDTQLFWWVNSHHCGVSDWVLWTLSQAWSWAIVLVAVFIAVTLRKDKKNWWVVLVGIALCFLLGDRISVMAFKDTVMRLRPCHALEGVRMFKTSCGGLYGFVSSHAANCFALAMFMSLMYGRKSELGKARKVTPALPYLLFAWAAAVGYSRPYLGKHYPGDVICGAIVGLGIGALVYFVMSLIKRSISLRSAA